jgi:hypothetical protein
MIVTARRSAEPGEVGAGMPPVDDEEIEAPVR